MPVQLDYARTADAAWSWTIKRSDSERSAKFNPVLLQERMNPAWSYSNSCDSQWFINRLHSIIIQRCLLARVPFTISLPTRISGWTKRNNRQRVRIKTERAAFGSVHLCVIALVPFIDQERGLIDWSLLFYINYQCEEQRSFLWRFTPLSHAAHLNAFTQVHQACVSSIITHLSHDGSLSFSDQDAVIHDNSVWLCQRWNCRLDRVTRIIEATELC